MSKKKIIKIKPDNLWVQPCGDYLLIGLDNCPWGKVGLSLKQGKRRVLISGKLDSIPNPTRMGLFYDHIFTPTAKGREKLNQIGPAAEVIEWKNP